MKSVKDTGNILNYNQWTCGDYENNFDSFSRTQSSTLTNKYSSLGEYSIQLARISGTWWINVIPISLPSTGTYIITVDVLNLSGEGTLLAYNGTDDLVSSVTIPFNTSWQTVSLTATYTNIGTPYIRLRNIGSNNNLFLDNIKMVKS